jgi:hypothetical protein
MRSMWSQSWTNALMLLLAGAAFTGCISTKTQPEPGVAKFTATDPTRVVLLPWAPTSAPYSRLGEIIVEPSSQASREEIIVELQGAVAAIGGHAFFIVSDPSHRFEVVQVDALESEQKPHYPKKGIVAVAIRLL